MTDKRKDEIPDDVAEALDACKAAFEGYRYMSQDAEKYIETLRAASTPSAEVRALREALDNAIGQLKCCADTFAEMQNGKQFESYNHDAFHHHANRVARECQKILNHAGGK